MLRLQRTNVAVKATKVSITRCPTVHKSKEPTGGDLLRRNRFGQNGRENHKLLIGGVSVQFVRRTYRFVNRHPE